MDLLKESEAKHNEAMNCLELATTKQCKTTRTIELFEKAFVSEKEAAELLKDVDIEPTRTILYRSAATLAFDLKRYNVAWELIQEGLSKNSPVELVEEMEELKNSINRISLDQFGKEFKLEEKAIASPFMNIRVTTIDKGLRFAAEDVAHIAGYGNDVDAMLSDLKENEISGMAYPEQLTLICEVGFFRALFGDILLLDAVKDYKGRL